MANPDIPAAIAVLQTHLAAAGAALTHDILDVSRGVLTGGRSIRYYWVGECEPPKMGGQRVLNGEMVGQRFVIAASWPLSDLSTAQVTALDTEMQTLAGEIRTRIQGDSTLGGNVTDLDLEYGEAQMLAIANARHVVMEWQLDLAYVEYAIAQ
jgi:hypothetical protein